VAGVSGTSKNNRPEKRLRWGSVVAQSEVLFPALKPGTSEQRGRVDFARCFTDFLLLFS
jgi:hypothetical protein